MTAEVFNPELLYITDKALSRIQFLIQDEGNTNLKFRVFLTGGGCSGFAYGFSFDEKVATDDTRINKEGTSILVDSLSYPYLQGSTIDYSEGLEGSKFIVTNPNAVSTCGCGLSFAV